MLIDLRFTPNYYVRDRVLLYQQWEVCLWSWSIDYQGAFSKYKKTVIWQIESYKSHAKYCRSRQIGTGWSLLIPACSRSSSWCEPESASFFDHLKISVLRNLTCRGVLTPYVDIHRGQHLSRQWLVAWRHQTITWTTLTYHQKCSMAITQEQFHRKRSWI